MRYRHLCWFFFFLFSSIITELNASTASEWINPGEELNQKLELKKNDHVLIKFSIVGTKNSLISFSIFQPNGTIKDFGNVGSFEYSFVCDLEGDYTLNFNNTDTTDNKLLTLNYKIDSNVFGIPKTLFQTLIIVLICLALVAGFILLSHPNSHIAINMCI